MSQDIARRNLKRNSLRQAGGARTVLLRMAADQERADRIRALKQERPDLTWRRIGDHVGVSERSAFEWGKKGGIDYANAVKLAEVLEVDVDYIWRGTGTTAPDLFGTPDDSDQSQLDRIEEKLDKMLRVLTRLATAGVPIPPAELGRVLEGEPPIAPTAKPKRRRAAGGS